MTSVELLSTEIGRLSIPVGRVDFYRLPVRNPKDFVCVPPKILSLADVQKISVELFRQEFEGTIGRYRWRKCN